MTKYSLIEHFAPSNTPSSTCQYFNTCSNPGVTITYTLLANDLGVTDLTPIYTSWETYPGVSMGQAVPGSSHNEAYVAPCNIPSGVNGAILNGIIPLVYGFNISPERICNLTITPNFLTAPSSTPSTTSSGTPSSSSLNSITVSFKLTDSNIRTPPLPNDYLPAGVLHLWIRNWLSAFDINNSSTYSPGSVIPSTFLTPSFVPLFSHFSNNASIEKYSDVGSTVDPTYTLPTTSAPTSSIQNTMPFAPSTSYPAIQFFNTALRSVVGLSAGAIATSTNFATRAPNQNAAIISGIIAAVLYDMNYDAVTLNNLVNKIIISFNSQTSASIPSNPSEIASNISANAIPNSNNVPPPYLIIITQLVTTLFSMISSPPPPGINMASQIYANMVLISCMEMLYCSESNVPPGTQLPAFITSYINTYNRTPSNTPIICPVSITGPSVSVPCSESYSTKPVSDNNNNTLILTGPNCAQGGSSVTYKPSGTILARAGVGKLYNSVKWQFNNGAIKDVSSDPSQNYTTTLPNTSGMYLVKLTLTNTITGQYLYSSIYIAVTAAATTTTVTATSTPPPTITDTSTPPTTNTSTPPTTADTSTPSTPSTPQNPAYISKNGLRVFADYTLTGTFTNFYNIFSGYPGGASKFNSDLISEIAASVKVSDSRFTVTNTSQVNTNDFKITIVINNVVPKNNIQSNDYYSALCVFNSFIAYINNSSLPACGVTLPQHYENIDEEENTTEKENTTENFIEHALLSSLSASSVSGTATQPANPVAVPKEPSKLFDFIFMYSYLFAILGSIFYSVTNTFSIDVPSAVVNKNVLLVLNLYIGLCGFFSLCFWFGQSIPFNTFFDENVIKSKVN